MSLALLRRFLVEPDPGVRRAFLRHAVWGGAAGLRRFRARAARGDPFPAFLFVSITNDCNLSCQGCWVTPTDPPGHLPIETLDRLVAESRAQGARFFGLLGGEPLRHPGLFEFLGRHRDCYFQLFTNGTLLTADAARALRELGNVTPLVSVEGLGPAADVRRGGTSVADRAFEAIEHCRRERLVTGVACSLCRTNVADLATEAFARDLVRRGALYLWYYLYRPVGPRPHPELALSAAEVREFRRFLVDLRRRVPLAVVDAYWDAEGRAVCPAALGISHHVNWAGDLEPCPVIQFAKERAGSGTPLHALFEGSEFIAGCRRLMADAGPGCILLRRPDRLLEYVDRAGARDTSGRGAARTELAALQPRADHAHPGEPIPEPRGFYRLAKRNLFWGLGAYG